VSILQIVEFQFKL